MTPLDPALLAAVRHAPDDDAPRLIAADWLDEHGESERAEFIRLQCRLWRTRHNHRHQEFGGPDGGCEACRLQRRSRQLVARQWTVWQASARVTGWSSIWLDTPSARPEGQPAQSGIVAVRFARGFADEVELSAADLIQFGDALVAAEPVRTVRVTSPVTADESPWPEAKGVRVFYVTDDPRKVTFTGEQIEASQRRVPGQFWLEALLRLRWPTVATWELAQPLAVPGPRRQAVHHVNGDRRDNRPENLRLVGGR